MRISVLGPLAVHASTGDVVTVKRAKVRALLADLLVHEGEPVSVDRLVEDLWETAPPRDPSGSLQVQVAQLRRAFADAEPDGRTLVVSTPAGYVLRAVEVDAVDFVRLAERARTVMEPREKAALLDEALALWRGPAYADFADEPFVQPAVARLTELWLVAVEDRAEALLALGEHDRLAGELDELVVRHPLRERLRAVHMRALYRAGRQSDALASYQALRVRLRDELGVDPGPDITDVHQAILRHDGGPARSNLPASLTDLIGRAAAIDEVGKLLDAHRLVTLTGSGGVGKTRLALATARLAATRDGVWLVELASASADTLAEAVLAGLGVREYRNVAPYDVLLTTLRDKQILLVLDNCEHVVSAVASLVSRLLKAAPGVRVLATSQERLGLPGETLYPVPPLDETHAVQLLTERVQALGFRLNDDVTELCRRLDCIPLALELAASRVPVLGVAELVARLDDRFRLLTDGYRDAPPRQRTLRAVLDWSWGLLSEPERTVLRRLSVHVEGCQLDAAQAVSGLDVLDQLSALAERSLVSVAHDETGPRYRLLESVTQYGLERLAEAGETASVELRHQTWYLDFAERGRDELYGPGQQNWIACLDREVPNLRAALAGMLRDGRADPALRLANALTGYWFLRGRRAESSRALKAALELGGSPALRAQAAVWQLGLDIVAGGSTDSVDAVLQEYTRHGADAARSHWFLGYALCVAGELDRSEVLIGRALAGVNGDTWVEAVALSVRAAQALQRNDLSTVEADGTRSEALLAELGDRWGQSQVLVPLAGLAEAKGDHRRATELHEQSRQLAQDLGLWSDAADRLNDLTRLRAWHS